MPDITISKRSAGGKIIASLVGIVLLVLVSEGLLRVATPNWSEFYNGHFLTNIFVPGYGTMIVGKAGFKGYFAQNNGDFRVQVGVNEFGLRSKRPVSSANGQIWTFGDSMTFGFGVEADETYTELIDAKLKVGAYNFSSPAGDVCSYQIMASRIDSGLRPRAVVVGLFVENDIRTYDCAASYKRHGRIETVPAAPNFVLSLPSIKFLLTKNSALYNFVAVSIKQVEVLNEALIGIGLVAREHVKKSHPSAEMTADMAASTASEIQNLRNRFPASTPFVVLLIPARHDIRDNDDYYRDLRLSAGKAIRKTGIPVVDPFPNLRAAGFRRVHFVHDGHWSRVGHQIAAGTLVDWLQSRYPKFSDR